MKTLVVYYSRTGNTRKVAEEIRNSLDCDIEELIETKYQTPYLWGFRAVIDAIRETSVGIDEIKNDPSNYDLLIIGTPVWRRISTPIRTYLTQNHPKFNNVAFFATAMSPNFDATFNLMKEISGKSPLAEAAIRSKEVKDGSYKTKVTEFVKKLQ